MVKSALYIYVSFLTFLERQDGLGYVKQLPGYQFDYNFPSMCIIILIKRSVVIQIGFKSAWKCCYLEPLPESLGIKININNYNIGF